MVGKVTPKKGFVPNWEFEKTVFVAPQKKSETCFAILKKCNAFIKGTDQSAFYSSTGGYLTEPWSLELPSGQVFRIIACMKQPTFWKEWLIQFCKHEGRMWALFRGDHMELADGSRIPMSECIFHEQ